MVGTQRSTVWWVHRGAGYGEYAEEQGMVSTQRSRVWWVHRGAGYGGYTEEQGMVGTHSSRVCWVHTGAGTQRSRYTKRMRLSITLSTSISIHLQKVQLLMATHCAYSSYS